MQKKKADKKEDEAKERTQVPYPCPNHEQCKSKRLAKVKKDAKRKNVRGKEKTQNKREQKEGEGKKVEENMDN